MTLLAKAAGIAISSLGILYFAAVLIFGGLTPEERGRVGVIAIFSTLSQKTRFDAVDFELFKLLGQQAAAALVSVSLFARDERRLPGLEAFLDLNV